MEVKEFDISVPWGHVAVKAWGDQEETPVVLLHGLGDNAGSFDRLIPMLPTSFYYICIDLPSHGRSSPFPPYLFINSIDNILTVKLILDYLNRKKYILIGHSWGAQIEVMFTQLYPEYVIKLILLDGLYFDPIEVDTFKKVLTEKFEILIKVNKNIAANKVPLYTYPELYAKLKDNRICGSLTQEAAEPILKRCTIPKGNGKYAVTNDPRLKAAMNPLFDMKYVIGLIKKYPITCPVLAILTNEENDPTFLKCNNSKEFIDAFVKNNNCILRRVNGNHDVHNNSPQLIAPLVNNFLVISQSKL